MLKANETLYSSAFMLPAQWGRMDVDDAYGVTWVLLILLPLRWLLIMEKESGKNTRQL